MAAAAQEAPWVMLSRVHKDGDVPEGESFMLAPVAPPRITTFTHFLGFDPDSPPYVVADDGCGRRFLLVTASRLVVSGGPSSAPRLAAHQQEEDAPLTVGPSSSSPTPRTGPRSSPLTTAADASSSSSSGIALPPRPASPRRKWFVCDAATDAALPIQTDGITDDDSVGILSAPGGDRFVVAYLATQLIPAGGVDITNADGAPGGDNLQASLADGIFTLVRYWSVTGRWTSTTVAHPQPAPRHGTDGVVANGEILWWADLDWGILGLKMFVGAPVPVFVPVPYAVDTGLSHKFRWIGVSKGTMRLVAMVQGDEAGDRVNLWSLNDVGSGRCWSFDFSISLTDIWADPMYRQFGLPEITPSICLVHPLKSYIVYFYVGSHIICVDMRENKVRECAFEDYAILEMSPSRILMAVPMPEAPGYDMNQQGAMNSIWHHLYRIHALAQDGETAHLVGIHLSNLGANLMQLNNGMVETSAYLNEAIPYLNFLSRSLGDTQASLFVQSSVLLLKCISEWVQTTSGAVSVGARVCSMAGLYLQGRHPFAQTGARPTSACLQTIVTVRSLVEVDEVIDTWTETGEVVVAEVEENLPCEEAREIHAKFISKGAYELIKNSEILLNKIQERDEREWLVV